MTQPTDSAWPSEVMPYIPPGSDEDPTVVKRWDYEPDAWKLILKEHGYVDMSASVIAPPSGSRLTGTLLVRAVRGGQETGPQQP
ncbi:hypothetical protein ACFYX8_00195 [Streptomyces cyaneofuscatus]|uniref:hypothetical protein n=1 Tax=Streptomyces cyaneofuscatus TaxID=66883 RepID=UPI0036A3572D